MYVISTIQVEYKRKIIHITLRKIGILVRTYLISYNSYSAS